MSVAGRRIWGDGNLARYGNKKSPASTSSCDGGSWEVGGWRLESAFWISLSVPAMAVGSRACIRSRVGRQERSGCSGCGGCGGCDGCSWGALDHSPIGLGPGLPVFQSPRNNAPMLPCFSFLTWRLILWQPVPITVQYCLRKFRKTHRLVASLLSTQHSALRGRGRSHAICCRSNLR